MTSFVGKDVFGVILAQNDVIMVTDVIILTYDVSFEFKLPPEHLQWYITSLFNLGPSALFRFFLNFDNKIKKKAKKGAGIEVDHYYTIK